MEIPKAKIKLLGKPYFNDGFIKEFIATIEKIAPNPDKYFLQLIQKDDKPTLEFGCKNGHILFDVTASSEKSTSFVVLFSAVNTLALSETQNATQFYGMSFAGKLFSYVAVTEDARKDLREYAEFLQMRLSSK